MPGFAIDRAIKSVFAALLCAAALPGPAAAQQPVYLEWDENQELAKCLLENYRSQIHSFEMRERIGEGERLDVTPWSECRMVSPLYGDVDVVFANALHDALRIAREDQFIECLYADGAAKAAIKTFLTGDFTGVTVESFQRLELPQTVQTRARTCDSQYIPAIFGTERYGRILALLYHRYRED